MSYKQRYQSSNTQHDIPAKSRHLKVDNHKRHIFAKFFKEFMTNIDNIEQG